jgi:predicted dehydrogenase
MSERHRIAIIGHTGRGNYGHDLEMAWGPIERAEVVAVADANPAGLANVARRLNIERTYADWRRMLDEVKPDVVTIAPRHIDQRHEMVVAAAERGIHMFVEKPLCRTLAEADAMVNACERTHAKVAVAFQTRYSPRIPVVKQLIEQGKIGTVLEYRARGKEDPRGGGEDLWVLGIHLMDLMRNLGGNAQWCMARVAQEGRPVARRDVVEGNEGIGPLAGDDVRAMYGMSDGASAFFSSRRNMAGRPSRFGLQVFGSRGMLEVLTGYLPTVKLLADPGWSPGRSDARWQDVTSAGIEQPEPQSEGTLHAGNVAAAKDLLDAIDENRQPLANIYEARAATEMIVAVFESHRLGRQVELPLENRENPLETLPEQR